MRAGWLNKVGRVLLVLGLAVGPWPSALAVVPMHADAPATDLPVDAVDVVTADTAPCPGHQAPSAAVPAPDCCEGDGAACGMPACASASCASAHTWSLLPPAPASPGLLTGSAGESTWISPSLLAPPAREHLRPPIA